MKNNPQENTPASGSGPVKMSRQQHRQHEVELFKTWVRRVLHLLVLLLSVFLILSISIDTFHGFGIDYYHRPSFVKTQLVICLVFLADFFIEMMMAERKLRYLKGRFWFLLVSIPYLWLIHALNLGTPSPQVAYVLQYIPLVRGGFALALVVGWFTRSKAASLFLTYLITLIATVYFSSLAFYMFEQNVNPAVKDYSDALWWAAMDVTTVGSNIVAVTGVGRVLSVALACFGVMMFPIFTVYITSLVQRNHNSNSDNTGSASA